MESPTSMTVGPVEYLLLSYREGRLGADVTTEAWRLVTSGTIRILDLTLIKKDEHGDLEVSKYDRPGGLAELAGIFAEVKGLLNQEDVAYARGLMEPGTSAALLVWETPWARALFARLRDAGVVLLQGGRVGNDIAVSAEAPAPVVAGSH
jgi:Family of unknown function (DUF6325)